MLTAAPPACPLPMHTYDCGQKHLLRRCPRAVRGGGKVCHLSGALKKKQPVVKKGCPVRRFRPDLARKGAGMITVMVPERALQRGARRRPSSWRLRAVHEHAKGVSQRASPVSGCGTHPCWKARAEDHHPRPHGWPRLCPVIVVPVRPVRRYFVVGEGHSCKVMHQKRRKESVTLSPR